MDQIGPFWNKWILTFLNDFLLFQDTKKTEEASVKTDPQAEEVVPQEALEVSEDEGETSEEDSSSSSEEEGIFRTQKKS